MKEIKNHVLEHTKDTMASVDTARPFWQSSPRAPRMPLDQAPSGREGDLDDIFNYDAEADQNAVTTGRTTAPRPPPEQQAYDAGNLGIDEEIKVRKPRAPIAKLDEDR